VEQGRAVDNDFAIFDEGNIPEEKLFCLSLLCFWYLCAFTQVHNPEVEAPASLPIAWQSSMDLEVEDANGESLLQNFLWIILLV
jgi:hypothetical protein